MRRGGVLGATALLGMAGLAYGQCGTTFYCDRSCPTAHPLVVSSSASGLNVSMKWTGIIGSPSVDNPSLTCETTFKDMLWRRHERATNCVWIPQAKINLRSGALAWGNLMGSYITMADADTSVGTPGDIDVVSGVWPTAEWAQAMLDADAAWAAIPKGIVAISADRLINGVGTSVARGIAIQGSIAFPYLIMADPDNLCQRDERSLAHEVGHVLGLGHTASGLMQSGGTGAVLTASEANSARTYLSANLATLDPPIGFEVGLSDHAIDDAGDVGRQMEHLDVVKVVAVDNARLTGDIMFCFANAAPYERGDRMQAFLALDTDNDERTGSPMGQLAPGMDFRGADFAIEMQLDPAGRPILGLYRSVAGVAWASIELLPGQASATFTPINRIVCDPTPAFRGEAVQAIASEAVMTLDSLLISRVGAGGRGKAFPEGLRFQMAMLDGAGGELLDIGPRQPRVMDFPDLPFPELFGQRRARPGEVIQIRVENMPPQVGLKCFLGPAMIPLPGVRTDGNGSATFQLPVPRDAPLGDILLTVGEDSPESAITADRGLTIVLCTADLDEDGRLTIFDFLTFQNLFAQGLEPADFNGDGVFDIFDFLAFQNAFDAGC